MSKITITEAQWQVLFDTLRGSLSIHDGATIWGFTMEARKNVFDSIWTQMNKNSTTIIKNE